MHTPQQYPSSCTDEITCQSVITDQWAGLFYSQVEMCWAGCN